MLITIIGYYKACLIIIVLPRSLIGYTTFLVMKLDCRTYATIINSSVAKNSNNVQSAGHSLGTICKHYTVDDWFGKRYIVGYC